MLKELLSIKRTVRYSPLLTAGIYLILSVLYIAFSDWVIARFVSDIETFARIQTLKGLSFVVISAGLMYFFIRTPLTKVYKTSISLAESEEKKRLIFESMTDGVVVIDANYKIVESNSTLVKICGASSKLALLQKDIFSYFDEKDHDRLRQDIEKTIKLGTSQVGDYNIKKTNGGQFPARVNAAILKDAEGKTSGIVAIVEDITESKQAQARLQELYQKERTQRQELQEESMARGIFIDTLAHELRTPLTPIMVSSHVLTDTLGIDDDIIKKKLVANIVEGSSTLSKRLEELLDIGRFSRGAFVLEQQTVDIQIYLRELVKSLQPELDKNAQRIKINIEPALSCLKIDPVRLSQVIKVLLSNAMILSPPNSEIGFNAGADKNCLFVEVEDRGPGLSQDELKRLFTPYHRTEQDRQKFPGIGLGMAVVRQIIEAHGGKIEVKSETNKGDRFRFEIPMNGAQYT